MSARAWQRMLSGRRLDLLAPSPLDVELDDIALGLSRVARWNGQTRGEFAFSVAQHALLCEAILCYLEPKAHPQLRLLALLHDASEYVIGDLISPFKAAIGADYKTIEALLLGAIYQRFGLPAEPTTRNWNTIKKVDGIAAYCEARMLADFSASEADKIFSKPKNFDALLPAIDQQLKPISSADAAELFIQAIQNIVTKVA